MKPFYLILTLIPALLIGRTVSAQISVDEVDAGEESVTFQDKLKSIPVDVDYFSRARYKAERAAIRKERNYLEFNSGVQGALTSYNDPWISRIRTNSWSRSPRRSRCPKTGPTVRS